MITAEAKAHDQAMSHDLVSRMTLAEKMAQLIYQAPEIGRLGVPAYNWWNECLHGVARSGTATVFPQAIGMAASFNTALMERVASAISDEVRAKYNGYRTFGRTGIYQGLTCWSPNINIVRDPRWGRAQETYGEDPILTASMAVAFVRGLQGNDPRYRKVDATLKHYAVHSGPEAERHGFDARVSARDLFETYLAAFRICIEEAEPAAVMGAYNRVNGEACCASPTLLQQILRDRFGFDGYVVSDCGAICDINRFHHVTADEAESAALAVQSGCDLNCGSAYASLKAAVLRGLIGEEAITRSAERLFASRYALGELTESPYDTIDDTVIDCPAHRELALQMARESIVLLKNDGTLPLSGNLRALAVIGPNSDDRSVLLGNYHGLPSRYTTIYEGICDTVPPGVRLFKARGSELLRPVTHDYAEQPLHEAILAAQKSDVVILCTGLRPDVEGEQGDAFNSDLGGDRRDIELPEAQLALFEALAAVGKPIVVVNTSGSAVSFAALEQRAAAILQVWYPGQSGGTAVADVLFGHASPSGKLPVTFYRSIADLPAFHDYAMAGRTYRYMTREPLYPFGFGLTYGRICLDSASPSALNVSEGEPAQIQVIVSNRENRPVTETVQVYLSHDDCPLPAPLLQLVAFSKVTVPPGASETVRLTIQPDRFRVFQDDGNDIFMPGRATLLAGCSLPIARSTELGAPPWLCIPVRLEG